QNLRRGPRREARRRGYRSPHSFCFQARTWSPAGETIRVSAPASSRACRGFTISSSNPSSMRIAISVLEDRSGLESSTEWMQLRGQLRRYAFWNARLRDRAGPASIRLEQVSNPQFQARQQLAAEVFVLAEDAVAAVGKDEDLAALGRQ